MMAKPLKLIHLGSFDTPHIESPMTPRYTLLHAIGPLAYRDGRLLIVGNRFCDAAWFKIPEYGKTAEFDGEWIDITYGKRESYITEIKEKTHKVTQFRIRGMFFDAKGLLHWSLSVWYNVGATNYLTLGVSDLEQQKSYGMWGSPQFFSLEWGGYLCPLSQEMRQATGALHGTGETIAQGSGMSNAGPSLFAFISPPVTVPHGTLIKSRPLLRYRKKENVVYPGYYGSWQINAMADLPGYTVWVGRRGKGREGYGHAKDIGFTPTCAADSKGYHSESYRPIMWIADHASLLAGHPQWVEQDLSEWVKQSCAIIQLTTDPASGKLYLMETAGLAESLPRIHVFSTEPSSAVR